MLKFIISGQTIKRTDTNRLVQYAQEYPEAEFTFDSDWDGLEKTVQWNMADDTYDTQIDDDKAIVPWELLRNEGVLNVNVVGVTENKVITTNTVSINVMGCGVVGGMVGGKPSESFYTALLASVEELQKYTSQLQQYVDGLKYDRSECFNVNDLLASGSIIQQRGINLISGDPPSERAVIDIDPETGIRILNNMPKDKDWYIKIGDGIESGNVQNGIMYRADGGDFWVIHNGNPILCLTPNSAGKNNIICGNDTLTIQTDHGFLSFDTESAGINYKAATWTENFKQLDVFTDKGVKMEAKNNSYWWVNEAKKAVYGNTLNKLEFRTDGVAKFSNVVNASDYQIGGKSVKNQLNEFNDKIKSQMIDYIAKTYNGNVAQLEYAKELSGGVVEEHPLNYNEDIEGYLCKDGTMFIVGEGVVTGNNISSQPNVVYSAIGNFEGKANVKRVVIFNGITGIGDESLWKIGFEEVVIPNSVASIGYNAFADCDSLADVNIPNSVTDIGMNAFRGCGSLVNVNISEGVTNIGNGAFFYCTSLASVNIPSSVVTISRETFEFCTSLVNVNISEGVVNIGDSAFKNCESLTNINIPNSVVDIHNWAFHNCDALKTITIDKPEGSIAGAPWGATKATVVWNG